VLYFTNHKTEPYRQRTTPPPAARTGEMVIEVNVTVIDIRAERYR
jgi:hypothetical protein